MKKLFQNISPHNMQKLLDLFESHSEKIKSGSTVQKNVKPKKCIGIVMKGCLHVIKNDPNGNQTIIEEYDEGSLFGNMVTSLDNSSFDIVAIEDSIIEIIDFENIMNVNINSVYYDIFIKNLLEIMSNSIIDCHQRINILSNKTIRNKLLEYFKIVAKKNNSNIIYLPFTFINLAEHLAIDRSAMSRELKYMKEEGLIEIKGKKIKLLYYVR